MTHINLFKINSLYSPSILEPPLEFSWTIVSSRNRTEQTAYQLILSDEEKNVWDSGKIFTERNIGIIYKGKDLVPLTKYHCILKVWDNHGQTASMEHAFFTGHMQLPWKSCWLSPVQEKSVPDISGSYFEPYVIDNSAKTHEELQPVQMLRFPFRTEKPVEKAFLFASAHGVYSLYLNGRKVGDQELAPGFSPYHTCTLYQTYEITDLLLSGKNVIGMLLGDGWWKGTTGLSGDNCQFGDRTECFIECHIYYTDGTGEILDGKNGRSHPSHIRYSDLFIGEFCDASAEIPEWNTIYCDDSSWKPLICTDTSTDILFPQPGEGVKIIKKLSPRSLFTTPAGERILDVGQNIAGYLELSLHTKAGRRITLEHSEMLDEHGNFLYCIKGRNNDQKDIYITREGRQSWHPLFTYHGFRYVKITGLPEGASLTDFSVCVLSTPMRETGSFTCSNPLLNQLHDNIRWSQAANTVSIPTDCPQREKAGWTGDIMIYSPTMCLLSDAESFLRQWLFYCRLEQHEDGLIPIVIPYLKQYKKFTDQVGSETSTGWGDAMVIVPWNLYQHTGNRNILKENYSAMKAWTEFCIASAEKGPVKYLWTSVFHFGDWLLPSIMAEEGAVPVTSSQRTKGIVAPAYFAHTVYLMSQIAETLDLKEDKQRYAVLFEEIRHTFARTFIHSDGTLDYEFQGAYVLCLAFHLVPPGLRQKMADHLCTLIEQNGFCLDTGFLSVPFLLDALADTGHLDAAYKLLFQTKCPGWLFMVRHGATTIWESWDCIKPDGTVGCYSFNHYAFGCVGQWLYTHLAGIKAIEPGYKRIQITPAIQSGLSFVNAKLSTPNGPLNVYWETDTGTLTVHLEIPCGTKADLCLPDTRLDVPCGKWDYSIPLTDPEGL